MIPDGVLGAFFRRYIDDRVNERAEIHDIFLNEGLLAFFQRFLDIVGNSMEFLGADHQIDMRGVFLQFSAQSLRHTSHISQDKLRFFPAKFSQHSHLADGLLFRHFPDTAGVQQNHIGIPLVGDQLVAAILQVTRHLFGVAFVHLATIGLDEDAGHDGKG